MIESLDVKFIVSLGTILLLTLVSAVIFIYLLLQKRVLQEQTKKHKAKVDFQKKLTDQIVKTQEEERKRIAQDLHDECGALILGIKANIESSLDDLGIKEMPGKSESLLDALSSKIRLITHNIYPASFRHGDLESALEKLSEQYNTIHNVKIQIRNDIHLSDIPTNNQVTLYRIITEWLNNSIKHGKAKNIKISFIVVDNNMMIEVEDDGASFNIEDSLRRSNGIGLRGITDRIQQLKSSYQYIQDESGHNILSINYVNDDG